MRPRSNIVFNIIHTKRLIFLTHFRLSLSHVSENRFKHSSLDALNLICICGFDIETLNLAFFHWPRFNNQRQNLLLKIEGVIPNIFIKTATGIKQKPFMEIWDFQMNLTAKYSIHLLNTSCSQKGLNLISDL